MFSGVYALLLVFVALTDATDEPVPIALSIKPPSLEVF